MRPHIMTPDRGYQPDTASLLHVKRDNTTFGGGRWRLAWLRPGDTTYCYAEGECSAQRFRTRTAAIAYGARAYGETAIRWPGRA